MVETFTQNEMIKAMYHELNVEGMVELENQIEKSSEIENNFQNLNVLKTQLNKLLASPSNEVIDNIMKYSMSYNK
jgi:hypothetical protein